MGQKLPTFFKYGPLANCNWTNHITYTANIFELLSSAIIGVAFLILSWLYTHYQLCHIVYMAMAKLAVNTWSVII